MKFQNHHHITLGNYSGIYHQSSLVNGKPSWKSNLRSIWSSSQVWIIGPVEYSGTMYGMIYSGFGNKCPFKLESGFWHYYDVFNGWTMAAANEINVECLKG